RVDLGQVAPRRTRCAPGSPREQEYQHMRKIIIATFALAAGLVIGVAACEPSESGTTTPRAGVVENAESAPEAPADDLTSAQRNAVRKAESYLEYSAFSESGLVTQLEFEGF